MPSQSPTDNPLPTLEIIKQRGYLKCGAQFTVTNVTDTRLGPAPPTEKNVYDIVMVRRRSFGASLVYIFLAACSSV